MKLLWFTVLMVLFFLLGLDSAIARNGQHKAYDQGVLHGRAECQKNACLK